MYEGSDLPALMSVSIGVTASVNDGPIKPPFLLLRVAEFELSGSTTCGTVLPEAFREEGGSEELTSVFESGNS